MRISGSNLAYFIKNTTFNGFNQKYRVDTRGEVKTDYVVLDSDGKGSQLYQAYMVDLKEGVLRFAGRSINFPGGSPPPSDSSCWFDENDICTGGMRLRGLHVCLPVFTTITCYFYVLALIHCPNFSPSGVEVMYIIIVLAIILSLAIGGFIISLYVRYGTQTQYDLLYVRIIMFEVSLFFSVNYF